jgi:hypothetical protein
MVDLHCPRCDWDFYMPVQPVYDLKFVAALLGIKHQTLLRHLQDHKYPRRYRWYSHQLRVRVLYAEEVQRIQKHYIRRHFKVAKSVAAEQRESTVGGDVARGHEEARQTGEEGPSGSV